MRIHSLPGSKRYPDSAAELSILLARQNTLATSILGEETPCVVVANPEYDPRLLARARGQRQLAGLALSPFMTVAATNPIEGGAPWSIPLSASRITWRTRGLDDVLTDVANHLIGPFLIAAESTGRVYAPYDGGADVFVGSSAERDEVRGKFASWMSSDPSGL